MDEVLEFDRRALEALREPLETGQVHIARVGHQAAFPARFQWILAHNPCPCGWRGHPVRVCRCRDEMVIKYRSRLSGPLLDRIDIGIEVHPVSEESLLSTREGDTSATVAERVAQAQARALRRQGCANAQLGADTLLEMSACSADATELLALVAKKQAWSARSVHRVLRVARTVADLDDSDTLGRKHIAEAIQYRRTLFER